MSDLVPFRSNSSNEPDINTACPLVHFLLDSAWTSEEEKDIQPEKVCYGWDGRDLIPRVYDSVLSVNPMLYPPSFSLGRMKEKPKADRIMNSFLTAVF